MYTVYVVHCGSFGKANAVQIDRVMMSEKAGTVAKHSFDSLKDVGLPAKLSSFCD